MRANLGEAPFRSSAEAVEDRSRDRELEDAVSEELEPLVRVGAILDPRRVSEDLLESVRGQLGDQPAELVEPGAVTNDLSPDAR